MLNQSKHQYLFRTAIKQDEQSSFESQIVDNIQKYGKSLEQFFSKPNVHNRNIRTITSQNYANLAKTIKILKGRYDSRNNNKQSQGFDYVQFIKNQNDKLRQQIQNMLGMKQQMENKIQQLEQKVQKYKKYYQQGLQSLQSNSYYNDSNVGLNQVLQSVNQILENTLLELGIDYKLNLPNSQGWSEVESKMFQFKHNVLNAFDQQRKQFNNKAQNHFNFIIKRLKNILYSQYDNNDSLQMPFQNITNKLEYSLNEFMYASQLRQYNRQSFQQMKQILSNTYHHINTAKQQSTKINKYFQMIKSSNLSIFHSINNAIEETQSFGNLIFSNQQQYIFEYQDMNKYDESQEIKWQ